MFPELISNYQLAVSLMRSTYRQPQQALLYSKGTLNKIIVDGKILHYLMAINEWFLHLHFSACCSTWPSGCYGVDAKSQYPSRSSIPLTAIALTINNQALNTFTLFRQTFYYVRLFWAWNLCSISYHYEGDIACHRRVGTSRVGGRPQ